MTGKSRNRLCILALIFVGIFSHLVWFNFSTTLNHGDWQYRTDDHVKSLWQTGGTWTSYTDFGGGNAILYSYPLRGVLWSGITLLGFSYDTAVKLTLMIPIAILGFLAPYFLA